MVSVLEIHIDSTLDISSTGTLLLAFPMGLRSLYIYTVTWSNNEVCPQTLRLEDRVRGPRGHKNHLSFSFFYTSLISIPASHLGYCRDSAPAAHNVFLRLMKNIHYFSLRRHISTMSILRGKSTAPLVSVSVTQFIALSTK